MLPFTPTCMQQSPAELPVIDHIHVGRSNRYPRARACTDVPPGYSSTRFILGRIDTITGEHDLFGFVQNSSTCPYRAPHSMPPAGNFPSTSPPLYFRQSSSSTTWISKSAWPFLARLIHAPPGSVSLACASRSSACSASSNFSGADRDGTWEMAVRRRPLPLERSLQMLPARVCTVAVSVPLLSCVQCYVHCSKFGQAVPLRSAIPLR